MGRGSGGLSRNGAGSGAAAGSISGAGATPAAIGSAAPRSGNPHDMPRSASTGRACPGSGSSTSNSLPHFSHVKVICMLVSVAVQARHPLGVIQGLGCDRIIGRSITNHALLTVRMTRPIGKVDCQDPLSSGSSTSRWLYSLKLRHNGMSLISALSGLKYQRSTTTQALPWARSVAPRRGKIQRARVLVAFSRKLIGRLAYFRAIVLFQCRPWRYESHTRILITQATAKRTAME